MLFKDAKGDNWTVEFTVGTRHRVLKLLEPQYGKVDLFEPLEGEPPLLTRMDLDIALQVDIYYAVLKPQIDEKQLSDEDFANRLNGQALFDLSEVFRQVWADFFRSRRRLHEAAAIEKEAEEVVRLWEKGAAIIQSEAMQKQFDAGREEFGESVLSSLPSRESRTSSDTPSGS